MYSKVFLKTFPVRFGLTERHMKIIIEKNSSSLRENMKFEWKCNLHCALQLPDFNEATE